MTLLSKPPRPVSAPALFLKGMIGANIIMFVVSLIFSGGSAGFSINPFQALSPSPDVLNFMGAAGRIPIDRFQAWESLITANWLHGSLLHILFNMMALRTIVPMVTAEYGLYRMFTIYTLAGALGFLLSYLGNIPLTIGASSGLCGLIGALLFFGKSRGGPRGQWVHKQTSGWIISLVIIGFLLPGINNWGHGGGLLGGVILGVVFQYNDRRGENLLDKGLALGLMAATLLFLVRPVVEGVYILFLRPAGG